ncbi:hypothetical protein [Victivallis sp. Marseille-Q1083]|uniref:hypothetical protein n=1 Tax=Victivallis sp. Marseille-Q1083 TaxID=2717288 RepID=UPI00158E5633|nr:hypothetical protein [Victivallis sp. Marseille-Q1083]
MKNNAMPDLDGFRKHLRPEAAFPALAAASRREEIEVGGIVVSGSFAAGDFSGLA